MVSEPKAKVNSPEEKGYALEGGVLTAREIYELGGPGKGTLDSLLRHALSGRQRSLFACDCADRALLRARLLGLEPDPRSWAAVGAARRYAEGEGSIPELQSLSKFAAEAAKHACHQVADASALGVVDRVAASWAARAAARSAYYVDDLMADWAIGLDNARNVSEAAINASASPDAELEWQTLRVLWYAEVEGQ